MSLENPNETFIYCYGLRKFKYYLRDDRRQTIDRRDATFDPELKRGDIDCANQNQNPTGT